MNSAPKVISVSADSAAPELVRLLLASSTSGPSLLGVYDDDDFLRYANETFMRAFRIRAGQVATFSSLILDAAKNGRTLRIETADAQTFIADAQMRRRGSISAPRQRSFPVDFVDGRWFWCTETLFPDGWIVLVGADITVLKKHESVLSHERDQALLLSGLDELTGVPNRRAAFARLDGLLASPPVSGHHVCVALIDLDHFKSINDTFGHETGDAALRHFAQHCIHSLPSDSIFARLGGEEFLVAFPNAAGAQAKDILNVLLHGIPPVTSRLPAQIQITLTFSAGLAEAHAGASRDELISRADRALYSAKRLGRCRVEIDSASG